MTKNYNDNTFTLDDQLDVAIPRFSTQTVLDEFPVPSVDDYAGPAIISNDNIASELSLQLPFNVSSARSRVRDGYIDMRYDLIRHDPLRGEETRTVGRRYCPAQGLLAFRTSPAHVLYKTVLTPVSAALASDVVDKNVATASTLIKILFPDTTPQDNIGMNARAVIRSLADQQFAPHRFVWRLASLYVAACWAEVNDSAISSNQRDIAPLISINSVHAYDGILAGWDPATQPVAVRYEGMADMVAPLIAVLRLAASRDPMLQTTNRLALPTVATNWPALGAAAVYYTGPRLNTDAILGNIDSATVWEAAMLWCGQHGTAQLFTSYIATVLTLWSGPVAGQSPILQSTRFSLSLPVSFLQPTILTPISQSYVTWRTEGVSADKPPKHHMFLVGAARTLAIGLAVRTYGYKAGMPYVSIMQRANTERDMILKEFSKRGDSCPAMFHAQATLRNIGCTGTLGGILLSMSPEFADAAALNSWWHSQQTAFQWEELAHLTNSVPRCCALLGVVRPLHTVKVPIVGVWYGAEMLLNTRSIEEAMQGLCYVPDLELAWQLTDARTGTVTTHLIRRTVNYRGSFSDWQFAPRYAKDFAKIEMTFRITTSAGALSANTGPMGSVPWKWYVTRPVEDEDLEFTGAPMLSADLRPQHVEHDEPNGSEDVTEQPPAKPPVDADASDEGVEHEAAPGMSAPGDKRKTSVPLSISMKADRVRQVLHDAGQDTEWLNQLLLGLERQYQTQDAWKERDREGRMRGAWDAVEQMDPTEVLRAVPNGARSNIALLMSQLYSAAAPHAHSLTASRGWIAESIRMGNRSRALKTCSALTKTELEDWTSVGRVRKTTGLTDKNIAMAIAAGVSAGDLVARPPLVKGGKLEADEEAWTTSRTGAQLVEESTTNEFEKLLKMAYDNGEATATDIQEMLAYTPSWLASTSKDEGDTNPADATPPVKPDPRLSPVLDSPEADQHVALGGKTVEAIKTGLIPGKDTNPQDFGNPSAPITMSPGMPPKNTSTQGLPSSTNPTNKDNTPPSTQAGDAKTAVVAETLRMGFTE